MAAETAGGIAPKVANSKTADKAAVTQPESGTETAAGERPIPKPRQYGFRANMDRHRAIAGVVERHVPDWRTSRRYREADVLKLICRDLDTEAADLMPENWREGNTPALARTRVKTWTEALEIATTGNKLVRDQIESSLDAIRRAEAETS